MADDVPTMVTVLPGTNFGEGGERIAVIQLSNPPMNVLSSVVARQLMAAADEVTADPDVRAIVLYGGEKVFAAGADVKEFEHAEPATILRHGLLLERAIAQIAAIPKPVVAAITGYALGGGCELALGADFRVSADNARWGQPEILLGIIPGGGGTQRLPRLIGSAAAKDIIYSGRFVSANEAHKLGLVDVVAPADGVIAAALELAGRFTAGPPTALATAKAAIDGGLETDLESGLKLERYLFAGLFGTSDKEIGVKSFIEKGPGKAVFPPPND